MEANLKNTADTSVEEIVEQLQEKRPLPLGMTEFNEWFDRLWSGAMITGEPGKERELELSARNVLANEIIHLPSGQTHEADIYFINRLRKVAANQVALSVVDASKKELMEIMQAKKAAEEAAKAAQ